MSDLIKQLRQAQSPRVKAAARILTIDIERLPGTAYLWEPKTRYVPPRNFIEWPRLLCFAARWYGQKRVIFEAEWKKGGRERMVQRAWELYDEADIIITYNGRRFDNKHLKTDWLQANYPPPRPWKDVDLYQVVSRHFGYESKSLDSVTRRLGRPGKESFYDIAQSFAAANGDKAAQKRLREYNIGDIELTEWLADRLRPWIHNHPHVGAASTEPSCNRCGAKELEKQPTQYRAVLIDYVMYRCTNCGGMVRGAWHARGHVVQGVGS